MGQGIQVDARAGLLIAAQFAGDANQKTAALKMVGTIDVNPASINANVVGVVTITDIKGISLGDLIFVQPPDTLELGLVMEGAAITGDNQIKISILNRTGSGIDGADLEWAFQIYAKA